MLSALLENEIVEMRNEEGEESAKEYMSIYGMQESSLDRLLEECSNILGL